MSFKVYNTIFNLFHSCNGKNKKIRNKKQNGLKGQTVVTCTKLESICITTSNKRYFAIILERGYNINIHLVFTFFTILFPLVYNIWINF
jgi:hypothetical protein